VTDNRSSNSHGGEHQEEREVHPDGRLKVDLVEMVGKVANSDGHEGGQARGEEKASQLAAEKNPHSDHLLIVEHGEAHIVANNGVLEHLQRAAIIHILRNQPEKTKKCPPVPTD
jgi:hypothetical protein